METVPIPASPPKAPAPVAPRASGGNGEFGRRLDALDDGTGFERHESVEPAGNERNRNSDTETARRASDRERNGSPPGDDATPSDAPDTAGDAAPQPPTETHADAAGDTAAADDSTDTADTAVPASEPPIVVSPLPAAGPAEIVSTDPVAPEPAEPSGDDGDALTRPPAVGAADAKTGPAAPKAPQETAHPAARDRHDQATAAKPASPAVAATPAIPAANNGPATPAEPAAPAEPASPAVPAAAATPASRPAAGTVHTPPAGAVAPALDGPALPIQGSVASGGAAASTPVAEAIQTQPDGNGRGTRSDDGGARDGKARSAADAFGNTPTAAGAAARPKGPAPVAAPAPGVQPPLAADPGAANPGDTLTVLQGDVPTNPAQAGQMPATHPAGIEIRPVVHAATMTHTPYNSQGAAQPAVQQIAIQVARAAHDGNDRITVELKPAALGRVSIHLEVGHDHRLIAVISADRTETLDLLQRDSRVLERALQDTGLKTDSGSLSFNLRGEGSNGEAADDTPLPAIYFGAYDSEAGEDPATPAGQVRYRVDGGIDIRI